MHGEWEAARLGHWVCGPLNVRNSQIPERGSYWSKTQTCRSWDDICAGSGDHDELAEDFVNVASTWVYLHARSRLRLKKVERKHNYYSCSDAPPEIFVNIVKAGIPLKMLCCIINRSKHDQHSNTLFFIMNWPYGHYVAKLLNDIPNQHNGDCHQFSNIGLCALSFSQEFRCMKPTKFIDEKLLLVINRKSIFVHLRIS